MDNIIFILIIALLCAVNILLILYSEQKNKKLRQLSNELHQQTTESVKLKTQLDGLNLREEELKSSQDEVSRRIKSEFELISKNIIEQSQHRVGELSQERLSTIIKPLQNEIKEFKDKIESTRTAQIEERTRIEEQIKSMVAVSQSMNKEAESLSKALRGNNKSAGNWGENVLENILQNSGLMEGKMGYELQSMVRDEQGSAQSNEQGKRMIPDAIVHFPDNRNVVIDSKVSISAYTDYCNADNEQDKRLYLQQHVNSIRAHIDGLSRKDYSSYVGGTLDFVMMFIPNDYAAMVAMQENLTLWQYAYDRKILIISPTNLITSLKIVSDLWTREKQQRNIDEIMKRGTSLLNKCNSFVDSMSRVKRALDSANDAYSSAQSQLTGKGGVVRQIEKLKELGLRSNKSMSMVSDEATDELLDTASEEWEEKKGSTTF